MSIMSFYAKNIETHKSYQKADKLTPPPISCQKGLDLAYRKRDHPGIVLKRTAQGGLLLGWVEDDPLSQEII